MQYIDDGAKREAANNPNFGYTQMEPNPGLLRFVELNPSPGWVVLT